MASVRTVSLALLALGLAFPSARAGFTYSDFSTVAGLQINGNASQQGNTLRLTPPTFFQSGSAFTTASTPLGNLASFSTYFQFRITDSGGIGDGDGVGADGIVFVVQTQSSTVGGAGGGIGYQGIAPSLGIEFDTYNNGEVSGNHVGIDINGSVNSITSVNEPTRFNNGQVWNAWVDYNGNTNGLEVRWSLSAVRPVASQLSATVNLPSILGQNSAFLGFTAGTGSGFGDQRILSWEYRDEFNPIVGAVPEPASVFLLGLGGFGLVSYACRRRRKPVVA